MSIARLIRSPRARRGIAASAIVLSLGGLVLFRTDAGANTGSYSDVHFANGTTFRGPGAAGSFSLSHGKILADGSQRVFAELRIRADEVDDDVARAPLSMAIVLDTSGSMDGDKMREAKQSVIRLLSQMRADDEVAFVRYDSRAELVQQLARVGDVRDRLIASVQGMEAGGGTNIPWAIRMGMDALGRASAGRVQRLVLVSDGLDSTRGESEMLAQDGSDRGLTVSTLGIGLDFDEAYMAGVARAGRGNFAFVQDASTLARFLERELEETARTRIERAMARLRLPRGLELTRALGAEAQQLGDGEVVLKLGSLFGGDERRVILELRAQPSVGQTLSIASDVSWQQVHGEHADITLSRLSLVATQDAGEVEASRDHRVWASAMSAFASARQLEAAAAYARGDVGTAQRLIDESLGELDAAAQAAPDDVARGLLEQKRSYESTKGRFATSAPGSADGRAAAKEATAADNANLSRQSY